jgi:hypothetical protein
MESKKLGGWYWSRWVALGLVILLIVYPLGLGPVAWFLETGEVPAWLETELILFYAPIAMAVHCLPEPVAKAYVGYIRWWAPRFT